MAKTRYFRVAGKQIDSTGLSKILEAQARLAQEAQMDAEVEDIVNELDVLLTNLSIKTSNRGRGFFAVNYNDPFADAPIVVKKRRNSNGDLSYSIRVDNAKFNILDQGRPAFSRKNPNNVMRFPRYSGKLTKPNSLELSNSPVKILDQRTVNDPNNLEQQIFGEGWVTVTEVAEVKPRNFIRKIAEKVRNRFIRRGFVKVSVRKS